MQPWWQEWTGRLEWELEALRRVCTKMEIVTQDEAEGLLVIYAVGEVTGRTVHLLIHFPSDYPYMRPLFYAPQDEFRWHQNPFARNLCLLGTAGDFWSTAQSAASLIEEQLPKLLDLNDGEPVDLTAAASMEEMQAEPFSVFLNYQQDSSMLLLAPLVPFGDAGTFRCKIGQDSSITRGLVFEAGFYAEQPSDGEELAAVLGYTQELSCRWVRLQERPTSAIAQEFLPKLIAARPELNHHQWTRQRDTRFELLAVVVPEEVDWRQSGETILFLRLELKTKGIAKPDIQARFIAKYVADRASLVERIPEVGDLRGRRVLLVGAGSLGSACALDLARVGLGSLYLLDGDRVEAGNAVRWALGVEYAGRYKVHALQQHIGRNFPYTAVVPFPHALGSQGFTLAIQRQVYEGVDLILDATADRGVSLALADRAIRLQIPYVCVSSTEGNWGGMVLNMRPARTSACWWCLMKRLEEGSLPNPPAGPVSGIQVRGCASPTFAGAMFDSTELSLQAVRCVVGDLSATYPQYPWDYAMLSLRGPAGEIIMPHWETAPLAPHPECPKFHEHLAY